MRISTINYSVKQGAKNIRRNKMFSLASIATMGACIFLFGLFFSIIMNFRYIVDNVEKGVAITVFFNKDATEDQIKKVGDQLDARAETYNVKYVSADDAWAKYKADYFKGNEDLMEGFTQDNPLAGSAHYEVYMNNVSKQEKVVKFAERLEGVRKVRRSDTVAKTLTSANRLLWYLSAGIVLILLGVSIFLISNTVMMGITVRRQEIAIMKYIGAKDSFVRLPFIIEGMLIGLIGAIIPLTILFFLYRKAVSYIVTKFALLNNIIEFLPVQDIYQYLLPIGLALGVGIGFVGSFFTIRKHLRA